MSPFTTRLSAERQAHIYFAHSGDSAHQATIIITAWLFVWGLTRQKAIGRVNPLRERGCGRLPPTVDKCKSRKPESGHLNSYLNRTSIRSMVGLDKIGAVVI